MSDRDTVSVEHRSPGEAFALLGDDIRVGIIRALGETPDEPLSFAELRERTGVRDSGKFNYHLGKLRGTFVRKTDEGYELTHAGRQIVGAMYAGTYTAAATIEPITLEGDCPICGGDIEITYADETVEMACTECETWYNEFSFPPGSLDQFDPEDLPAAFDRWMKLTFRFITDGFCDVCAGRLEGRLVLDDPADRIAGNPAHAAFVCPRCGNTGRTSSTMPVLYHPAVEGFLYEHELDVRKDFSWQIGAEVGLPEVELLSEDPIRLAVTLTHGGERITATVEPDATVSSVERTPVSG